MAIRHFSSRRFWLPSLPRTDRIPSCKHTPAFLTLDALENRLTLSAPAAPVIIEPLTNGQVVSNFDVHMEIDPDAYVDADGDAHQGTSWQIRETPANGGAVVWQALGVTDPLSKNHIHLGDGAFVGTLAGRTALLPARDYVLHATFTDTNGEVSATSARAFRTAAETTPVPGAGTWIVREGYQLELAAPAQAFRLPVNIAFVPNPGPNPGDPLYYVAELYGSIKIVTRGGQVSNYATGLLDYNPSGPISGTGEQGLSGLAVDPATGDLFVGMLWNNGTTDAQRGGATLHFPKVERLHSTDGGRTIASRTILLNMQPETQGQSHQISNISLGPDARLYVHMGDGFTASTALNLDQYRGKVLRMNLNGTAPTDNPFYNAADGINARDYVYTYGHRNPFGGAWRAANNVHYVVENGNALDRLVNLTRGQSYGWAGNDSALTANSLYVWNPATAPVNIAFVQPQTFGGSLFPADAQDDAFVTLSGPTYAAGPQANGKRLEQFTDLDTLNSSGKLATAPLTLLRYNGTGRGTLSALAAGPDGLYFSDLYRDDGAGGATAVGANVYRIRYVDFHPSTVTGLAGDGQVVLNWTPDPLAVSHNVYRSVGGGTPVLVGAGVAGTSFTDTTVTNGTHYHYVVRGVNTGGESSDSNEVHATPNVPAGDPPTVASPASALPNPAGGTTVNLSVLGDDDGTEANLRYTWALAGTAPAPVTFSANGNNAAKETTATFTAAGTYDFIVTIRDTGGQTVQSNITVTVNQTLTSVTISPASASIVAGTTRQFTATARDQFGNPLTSQPVFDWSIDAGGVGTISSTGLYQAPATPGAASIRATSGSFSGAAAVTVTPVSGTGNGLTAVYFNNSNLTGTSIVRTDATVNFNFNGGSPNSFIGSDTFSARWIGAVEPRFSETYTFRTTSNDGVRLWVNDQLIIDQWNNHSATEHTGTIALTAGQRYPIRLEYYDNTGTAVIRMEWQSPGQARQIVPQSQLYSGVPIKVNFQPAAASVPSGYLADTGAVFGSRGNGFSYGWNGNNASSALDRNSSRSPDQRYDTLTRMQRPVLPNAVWELAVPNGSYRVHVVSGDANSTNSVYRINVEGVLVVSGTPTSGQRWIEGWRDVVVGDGRLTVTNGAGARNNRINFIDVIPLGVASGASSSSSSSSSSASGTALPGESATPPGLIGRGPGAAAADDELTELLDDLLDVFDLLGIRDRLG